MGPHGTASTRIVRPTALGSRFGSLQGGSLCRDGLRYARHARLRPRVARGVAPRRLLWYGGVARSASQAAVRRVLLAAQIAPYPRTDLPRTGGGSRTDRLAQA